jgi:hypothetical protein
VQVTCSGRGCPLRSQIRSVASAQKGAPGPLFFPRFERTLIPGVTLQIRISGPGLVGKYTSFKIRRGKLPVRSDGCLQATNPTPVVCPA